MMTSTPTDMDVLLGRGVGTSRRQGNQHFRLIVSECVDDYMKSTKKQKMAISRSIVDRMKNEFNARFLQKCTGSNLWIEVDRKRALEKTAQALRDGAAPLKRGRMEEEWTATLSRENTRSETPLLMTSMNNMCMASKSKKHQRTITAPIIQEEIPSLSDLPCHKKRRLHSNALAETETSAPTKHYFTLHATGQSAMNAELHAETETSAPTKHYFTLHATGQSAMNANCMLKTAILISSSSPAMEHPYEENWISVANEDASLASAVVKVSAVSNASSSYSMTEYNHGKNNDMDDTFDALINDLNETRAIDDDAEFAKEMGPDEHFFGLCTSDPINDIDGYDLFAC
eukprot:CAMPEP_0183743744 /NCGR_PEP_ID=MMETSP0737-20130205/65377_1 /TAXON_ID=385413 /ORGANISM="Thalassiosira miniscula, Strain CCMP1093" /LENGTH=343 /DNA_ID=CAMNT_0025979373 /DNA_START=71 /DNA_END=1101 /DNA_ORIENTATION=-